MQEDKAHGEGHNNSVNKNNVREYRQRKRRVMTEKSDNNAALRAQQVRDERKPVEKGKYQRLNRFGSSNYKMYPEDNSSMDSTRKGDTTFMQRKKTQTLSRQQRQHLQAQKRPTNATTGAKTENLNGSTELASDFTYEAPQVPSPAT